MESSEVIDAALIAHWDQEKNLWFSGYFMYVPVVASTPISHAYLRNPSIVKDSSPLCLHFDFLITTAGAARLSVLLFSGNGAVFTDETIWLTNGDKERFGEWQRGQVFIQRKQLWTVS